MDNSKLSLPPTFNLDIHTEGLPLHANIRDFNDFVTLKIGLRPELAPDSGVTFFLEDSGDAQIESMIRDIFEARPALKDKILKDAPEYENPEQPLRDLTGEIDVEVEGAGD